MKTLVKESRRCSAFTLLELIVASGLATLVMGMIMVSLMFCSRSFVAIGNYTDLNKNSLIALDRLTRDIREASSLKTFAPDQLVFLDAKNNPLTFAWNPKSKELTRSAGGRTTTLLKDCDYLTFNIFQRSPTTDGAMDFYTASNNASLCKLVSVSWRCSRTILGQQLNTESVQTAKIVIRN